MHLWTGKSQYILELIRGSSRIWTPDRIGFVLAEVCALQVLLPLIDFLNCMGNYEVTLSLCFTSTYVYAGYGYHVFNNDFFDIKIRQIYYEYNVPLYFLTQLNIETCKPAYRDPDTHSRKILQDISPNLIPKNPPHKKIPKPWRCTRKITLGIPQHSPVINYPSPPENPPNVS